MEKFLIALATRFERIADGLRRQAATIAKARLAREPGPIGLWRCTVSCDIFAHNFVVGEVYPARYLPGTSSIRIYPRQDSFWAPYWEPLEQRFCYPADQLDFEFVGATD